MQLPDFLIQPVIQRGLEEDLARGGDLTTQSIISPERQAQVALVARADGVVAGGACPRLSWAAVDPRIQVEYLVQDGEQVVAGQEIARATGPAVGLLMGERVGLNLLCRLSGIATATARMQQLIAHASAHIVDTRKTTPGLRALEKYAVRCGGGKNHRFGLDDAVLIKDNHIAVAGGIEQAVSAARKSLGHMVKIEVEVDTLEQLQQLLAFKVDAVLLDNMSPETLRQAVKLVDGAFLTEASGGITPETVVAVAEAGVDMISMGWLTHSAPILDVGLDYC